jgi:hypothetical protein
MMKMKIPPRACSGSVQIAPPRWRTVNREGRHRRRRPLGRGCSRLGVRKNFPKTLKNA